MLSCTIVAVAGELLSCTTVHHCGYSSSNALLHHFSWGWSVANLHHEESWLLVIFLSLGQENPVSLGLPALPGPMAAVPAIEAFVIAVLRCCLLVAAFSTLLTRWRSSSSLRAATHEPGGAATLTLLHLLQPLLLGEKELALFMWPFCRLETVFRSLQPPVTSSNDNSEMSRSVSIERASCKNLGSTTCKNFSTT